MQTEYRKLPGKIWIAGSLRGGKEAHVQTGRFTFLPICAGTLAYIGQKIVLDKHTVMVQYLIPRSDHKAGGTKQLE